MPYTGCTIAQAGSNLIISEDKRTVTRENNLDKTNNEAVGTPCTHFTVRVVRNCERLMVGFNTLENIRYANNSIEPDRKRVFTDQEEDRDQDIYTHWYNPPKKIPRRTGYYMIFENGKLHGEGIYNKPYGRDCFLPGTFITCVWRPSEATIRFYIEGVDYGVAFRNVPSGGLLPAFSVHSPDTCFELCDIPTPRAYTGCVIAHYEPEALVLSTDGRVIRKYGSPVIYHEDT